MTTAVFGGAGFIGSHLVGALVSAGEPVRVFDRPNARRHNLASVWDRIEFVGGDFANKMDVERALEGAKCAYHLVSTTLPKDSNENPTYDVSTNLVGSLHLLDAAVRCGTDKVIFASSGGTVYGVAGNDPIPETHATNPICSYGIVKLAIEKYLHLYGRLRGLDHTVVRISNPFGPRQDPASPQGAVAVFLARVLLGQPIEIWGDGSVARDFVFIDDVTSALLRVASPRLPSLVYNIGSGRATTLLTLLDTIRKVAKVEPTVRFTPCRPVDVPVNCLDIRRAREELGWEPPTSLREGIARTYASLTETSAS